MTEQEQNQELRLLRDEREDIRKTILCLESKLDRIADHLVEIAQIACREIPFSEQAHLNAYGDIRIGHKTVAHTDEEIITNLKKLDQYKVKFTKINYKIKRFNSLPE